MNVGVYFHSVTLELVCECGRNVGEGMHSPDVCAFGVFLFIIYSKLNNLSGYLRPYFCLLRAC